MAVIRLVVGLGNPTDEYVGTRHNVGFALVDRIAPDWTRFKKAPGEVARLGSLWLAKPLTFMNESGRFVQAFCHWHDIKPQETLVCFDDVALPLGRLRIRPSGSSGGQKGMQSIIDFAGTNDVPRLRIGIGPQPPGMDSAHFVLRRFNKEEQKQLPAVLDLAADAVRAACKDGIEAAMNRYNTANGSVP